MKKIEDIINKVHCSDCLTFMKDIPDKSVDLVLTDPPYNVKKDYGKYKDKLKPKEYLDWIEKLISEFKRISDNRMVIVVGSKMLREWWNYIPDAKLVIVKMGATSNNRIKGLSLQFHPVLTTVKSSRLIPDIWEDIRWPGEGYFFNEQRWGHPAMTPLKLSERCISIFSEEDNVILDPFMGVGTIAVASQKSKRKFIGIELNPEYIKIAEERLRQKPLL